MNRVQLRITSVAFILTNFMTGLDTTIVNTALPSIVHDLNAIAELGLLTSMYLFGVAISTVIWGEIARIVGNKGPFLLATLIFALSSLMGGFATTIQWVIVARLLMGIGAGGMVALPFVIYAEIYPNVRERAKMTGWASTSYAVSTMVGPIIGGWLVDLLSWHWVFLINVPIGLLSVLLVFLFYQPAITKNETTDFDVIGAMFLVLSLILLIHLFENLTALSIWQISGQFMLTLLVLGAFWRIEKKAVKPIIPLKLFKNRFYILQTSIQVIILCSTLAYGIYAPLWAQNILGTSATLGGATQIASSLFMLIATRITSNLYGRIATTRQIMFGLSALLVSALMLSLAQVNFSYFYIVASGVFQGIGMGFDFSILTVTIQQTVEKSLVSVATTLNMLLRTIGQTMAAAIYGLIYNHVIQSGLTQQITSHIISSLNSTKLMDQLSMTVRMQARQIAFQGIHVVFIAVLLIVILGLILNFRAWDNHQNESVNNHDQ